MNNSLVSIIIPVYNVEKYLDRCVESAVNQTYKNIEIILVDDGSPDNCPALCDKWAEKDERIRVIHKDNGGLSDARNAGIDASDGEWVFFLDSDDYISVNAIELLYRVASSSKCQIAAGRFARFDDSGLIDNECYSDIVEIVDEEQFWLKYYNRLFEDDYLGYSTMIISCAKLINMSVFNGLRFDLSRLHEDEFIIHKMICGCEKIALADSLVYYYYQNPDSITKNITLKNIMDAVDAFENRISYIKKYNIVHDYAALAYLRYITQHYFDVKKTFCDEDYSKKLLQKFRECYNSIRRSENVKIDNYCKSFFLNENLFRVYRKMNKYFSKVNHGKI